MSSDAPAQESDDSRPSHVPEVAEHTYSVRLLQPFLNLLRPTGLIPDETRAELEGLGLDFRIPARVAHQMLQTASEVSGNPYLGLEAARATTPNNAGVVDYAISSAATVRAAIEAAARYMRLVNDALEIRLVPQGPEVFVQLENRVPMPRAALDFQVGALYRAFSSVWSSGARASLRVQFAQPAPDSRAQYELTFNGVPVEFDAPMTGFVFDASCLDQRLTSAETRLHEVILGHAEQMLRDLPQTEQFTERVRAAVAAELAGGNPGVAEVARRFHMSPRTLERRLEREGTTFSALLDELRKRLALRYVGSQDLELAEIAFLLGFSQTTGFHRAFKRWTGTTPLEYRRATRSKP
jgi:AraC-like DNA-binding protein